MKVSLFTAVLLWLGTTATARAEDWPQWRGPQRNGHTPASLPITWPDALQLLWRVPIGTGHASPIVIGDSVYVHTRIDEREIAACLDLTTGTTLWQQDLAVAYTINSAAYGHGKGPKSTPLVQGDLLYTFGIAGVLSCYDRHSGALQWRYDPAGEFSPTSPLYGTATSPLYTDGLLIAHVGGHEDGALRAFDAQTGAVRWSWAQD